MVHFSHEGRVKNRELASSQRNIESILKLICDFVKLMKRIYYIIEIIILIMYF